MEVVLTSRHREIRNTNEFHYGINTSGSVRGSLRSPIFVTPWNSFVRVLFPFFLFFPSFSFSFIIPRVSLRCQKSLNWKKFYFPLPLLTWMYLVLERNSALFSPSGKDTPGANNGEEHERGVRKFACTTLEYRDHLKYYLRSL